jgi:glycosyltransferase involved in cell wall biosynthesis
LANAGFEIDAFLPSTADESFCPLKDIVRRCEIFPVPRSALGAAGSTLRRTFRLGNSLVDQEKTQMSIAREINRAAYDAVLVEQDKETYSPFLLKYLTGPSVYYCQQPDRSQEAILQTVEQVAGPTHRNQWYRQWWRGYRNSRIAALDKAHASFASCILANSYFSREAILRAYGRNAFVSYLGTDADLFRPLSVDRDSFVLSVGSCTVAKGYDFLIRSLGLIDAGIRPGMLVVANFTDAAWEAYLVRLAAKLGVELSIRKSVPDNDLVQLYNRAKLVLYAPFLEPFGLVPLEAMACGTPVVAVKEGGMRESVQHNETGILVDRDEEAFAQATAELLGDDAQRKRMACRALDVVRTFWTWTLAAERLAGHLERAATRGRVPDSMPLNQGAQPALQ